MKQKKAFNVVICILRFVTVFGVAGILTIGCNPVVTPNIIEAFDHFNTNTTGNYIWKEVGDGGDGNPANNYVYDQVNKWVTITTADDDNIIIGRDLSKTFTSGYFKISFMPWKTWPTDGVTEISVHGGGGDRYVFSFAHVSSNPDPGNNNQYRANVQKWIGGNAVINRIFIPSPDRYILNEWHTLSIRFSPTTFTGYLDGIEIMSVNDPNANIIPVNYFRIIFMQQDQHLDNIIILCCH